MESKDKEIESDFKESEDEEDLRRFMRGGLGAK